MIITLKIMMSAKMIAHLPFVETESFILLGLEGIRIATMETMPLMMTALTAISVDVETVLFRQLEKLPKSAMMEIKLIMITALSTA